MKTNYETIQVGVEEGVALLTMNNPPVNQFSPRLAEDFYRAVRRVSTLSTDRSTPLKFTFKEGGVTISAVNPEVGEATEDLEADFQGEDLEIGLNARYVIDTFSVIDQDKVRIGMNESLSPGLVQPIDDDDYQCVIMPMRL